MTINQTKCDQCGKVHERVSCMWAPQKLVQVLIPGAKALDFCNVECLVDWAVWAGEKLAQPTTTFDPSQPK